MLPVRYQEIKATHHCCKYGKVGVTEQLCIKDPRGFTLSLQAAGTFQSSAAKGKASA